MLNHLHGTKNGPRPAGSMEGWGHTYDAMVSLMTLGKEKKIRQATLEMARLRPGERILEVGCGTGSLTLVAKAKVGDKSQVTGIDIAPDMIETARRKAQKAGLNIQFQVGRIENIPFPEDEFDIVLSSLMLHHVPELAAKQQGFREVLRVLKPGGRFLIVDMAPPQNPHVRSLASLFVGREMLSHGLAEYIPLLEEAGFTDIDTGPTKSSFLAYLSGIRP